MASVPCSSMTPRRWDLVDADGPEWRSLPANLEQPGLRGRDRAFLRRHQPAPPRLVVPAVEPPPRRERIDAVEPLIDALAVPARVLQHVAQRVARLRRRREDLDVVAVI